eukprot:gene805-1001_t
MFFKRLVGKDGKHKSSSSKQQQQQPISNSSQHDIPDELKAEGGLPTNGKSVVDEDGEIEQIDFGENAVEPPEEKKKLWSKVSGLVGKDTMSLVSLPVYFFEPITVLQSQIEPLRFVDLINKACEMDNSMDRMCYITAFNIAVFSSYVRTSKPFNPLLGETFEYIPWDGSYRTFGEQVSHHPPIGVVETSCEKFNLQQESWITTKFWGNSVDVFSHGQNHLYIPKYNDHYTWKVPSSCCHNIIIGKMWIEHHGMMTIQNQSTGERASINFHKSGWFEGSSKKISGEILDSNGKVRYLVTGKWNEAIILTKLDSNGVKMSDFTIWKKEIDPAEKENKWKHGTFIQSLNDLPADYEKILPITDSRLRSDRRYLQAQDNKLANREKNRIEEMERAKRKERDSSGKTWNPVYFKKVLDKQFGYRWLFNGQYWRERETRVNAFEENKRNLKMSAIHIPLAREEAKKYGAFSGGEPTGDETAELSDNLATLVSFQEDNDKTVLKYQSATPHDPHHPTPAGTSTN